MPMQVCKKWDVKCRHFKFVLLHVKLPDAFLGCFPLFFGKQPEITNRVKLDLITDLKVIFYGTCC